MAINYQERIPNNVDLGNDRRLQRALEHWQPRFLDWWRELGPEGFQTSDVYLRTATSVDAKGWATFGAVKMPDYRWGIFLADQEKDRTIGFGDDFGKPVWQQVPGEYRSILRRLIVTQGDTEPASVDVPLSLICVISFRSMWKRGGISGPWSICCTPISGAMAGRRRKIF